MNRTEQFKKYFEGLSKVAQQGDAREESFYPALADMLQGIAEASGRSDVHVTTLPSPTEGGNPDFRLWNGRNHVIGYIEAKKPTQENLNPIEGSEQLKRYRSTFPNLILTNFLEFRLYRDGQRADSVVAGHPVALNTLKTAPPVAKGSELYALLDRFMGFALPKSFTAKSLAVELAKRTRFMRDVVRQQMQHEENKPDVLSGFFEAFQTYLIGSLTHDAFSDLFAQTITYGLFAARTRAGEEFTRQTAFDNIPHTIGVLRDVFRFISFGDLPEELAWCVDDIAEVLAVADASGILDRYYHEGKGSDPIVHFYETFLTEYDPSEREKRGVYYTPEPVVCYIVRSLHGLLKDEFDKPDGLASKGVTLLDPAAGTMTFVARAAQEAVKEFESKYGSGNKEEFVRGHILKNFYAFELMMAPYAVGHLKMSFFLEELGHRLNEDERMPFYLTNTLDTEELEQSRLPGFSALAEESQLAGKVKRKTPILVILGNPPYSGHSSNKGDWIRGLIDDYKQVDGKPLGERNPKMLQDDYVKFIRFAQWKIDQAGRGVVGMITNHGYLDNPTFRGMRQSLMQTFDAIHILDLHGNSLKKETRPDGSPDKNVFDIMQGVAIAFFVKYGGSNTVTTDCKVNHAELYGVRGTKYDWLKAHDRNETEWEQLNPSSPFYLFVPRDNREEATFYSYPSVTEIFPINSTGIKTHRDHFVFDFDRAALLRRIGQFCDMNLPDAVIKKAYGLKGTQSWKLKPRRKQLGNVHGLEQFTVKCLYRPFDFRELFYHPCLVDRPRTEVMRHMLAAQNLALLVSRQAAQGFRHAFVTDKVSSFNNTDIAGRFGAGYHFPLYLHPEIDKEDLFSVYETPGPRPNLNGQVISNLRQAYNTEPKPETIFYYIYAVLYAPTYRKKYAEFLRMDFPRVPFTADADLFRELAALGERLAKLHLLKSSELDTPMCRFEGKGDAVVAKTKSKGFRYEPEEQRMYINKTQYFAPVTPEVHEYQVGGYQVCEKWLKDRKERKLTVDDTQTYCRIVTALAKTIEIQQEIDALYPRVEENPLDMGGEQK